MYAIQFSTIDIDECIDEYLYTFNKNLYLNLYYVNNFFSKLMFRDVYKDNNYFSEDTGLDIWVTQCSQYKGPMALKDAKQILINRHQNRYRISIHSVSEQIDLECWRLEIYKHNQDRGNFFPLIDSDRLPIFNHKNLPS